MCVCVRAQMRFDGGYSYNEEPPIEEVTGVDSIAEGRKKVQENPAVYEAIFYQSEMAEWDVIKGVQPQYYLVKRKRKTGMVVESNPEGTFTFLKAKYEVLPSCAVEAEDTYTTSTLRGYQGCLLQDGLQPGRGQGCADVPGLKMFGDVDPNDIAQGQVGDCWLLSGFSSLAEYDGIIKHLFRHQLWHCRCMHAY